MVATVLPASKVAVESLSIARVFRLLPDSRVAVEFSLSVILFSVLPLLSVTVPESVTRNPSPLPTEMAPLDVNVEFWLMMNSAVVESDAVDSTVKFPSNPT